MLQIELKKYAIDTIDQIPSDYHGMVSADGIQFNWYPDFPLDLPYSEERDDIYAEVVHALLHSEDACLAIIARKCNARQKLSPVEDLLLTLEILNQTRIIMQYRETLCEAI